MADPPNTGPGPAPGTLWNWYEFEFLWTDDPYANYPAGFQNGPNNSLGYYHCCTKNAGHSLMAAYLKAIGGRHGWQDDQWGNNFFDYIHYGIERGLADILNGGQSWIVWWDGYTQPVYDYLTRPVSSGGFGPINEP